MFVLFLTTAINDYLTVSLYTFKSAIWPIRDKLYRFAFRFLQNASEAEDVVQEVFFKLWRARNQWEQIDNLEAWSMCMTRNLALDQLRSKKYRRTEEVEQYGHLSSADRTPLEQAEHGLQLMDQKAEQVLKVVLEP